MCVQCMMGAATAATAATGLRAWLVAHAPAWLTPRRKTMMTRGLIAAGVLAAGVIGPGAASPVS